MNEKILKAVFAYSGLSQASIARAIGMSPQNFGRRVSRNTFSDEELAKIGEVIGATFRPAQFVFPDGKEF